MEVVYPLGLISQESQVRILPPQPFGGIAQLGEHLLCKQGVIGSIPFTSTKFKESIMSGKGSSPRPYSVDRKTFENNWDRIFSDRKQESEQQVLDQDQDKDKQTDDK